MKIATILTAIQHFFRNNELVIEDELDDIQTADNIKRLKMTAFFHTTNPGYYLTIKSKILL
jgi:hypothetical protein